MSGSLRSRDKLKRTGRLARCPVPKPPGRGCRSQDGQGVIRDVRGVGRNFSSGICNAYMTSLLLPRRY